MIFVLLAKYRMKPSKETLDKSTKLFDMMAKDGIKFLGQYWTLGKYDIVSLAEAKDEKTMLKAVLRWGRLVIFTNHDCATKRRSNQTCRITKLIRLP